MFFSLFRASDLSKNKKGIKNGRPVSLSPACLPAYYSPCTYASMSRHRLTFILIQGIFFSLSFPFRGCFSVWNPLIVIYQRFLSILLNEPYPALQCLSISFWNLLAEFRFLVPYWTLLCPALVFCWGVRLRLIVIACRVISREWTNAEFMMAACIISFFFGSTNQPRDEISTCLHFVYIFSRVACIAHYVSPSVLTFMPQTSATT